MTCVELNSPTWADGCIELGPYCHGSSIACLRLNGGFRGHCLQFAHEGMAVVTNYQWMQSVGEEVEEAVGRRTAES